jgi:hypothetical protein
LELVFCCAAFLHPTSSIHDPKEAKGGVKARREIAESRA